MDSVAIAFQFKVGDIVAHKIASDVPVESTPRWMGGSGVRMRYTVLSRMTEQCTGGVQIMYSCRGVLSNGEVTDKIVRIWQEELVESEPFKIEMRPSRTDAG